MFLPKRNFPSINHLYFHQRAPKIVNFDEQLKIDREYMIYVLKNLFFFEETFVYVK